jgi:PAS domain S-box-containing protein
VLASLRKVVALWTPADLDERPVLFAAQVRALRSGAHTSIPFGVVVGAFLVWAYWGAVPRSALLMWFASLLLVSVARALIQRRTPGAVALDRAVSLRSYRVLVTGVLAAGAVWGATSFVVLDPGEQRSRLMLGLLLCGVTAGATGTLAPRLPLAVGFSALLLGPYVARMLAVGDEGGLRLALLGLLFLVGMLLVARNASRTFTSAEELRQHSEAHAADLAAERNRFFALFDALPDPLTVLDQDRRIVHINRAFESSFGWDAGDALGRTADLVLPDPRAWERIADTLRLGMLAGARPPLELTFRARDGRAIECEVSMRRVADPAGGPVLYLLRAHDVTERKRMQRLQDRFVSTVSHELRTPLTALSGAIRLLEGGAPLPDAQRGELIRIAQRNSDRLLHLVNDILDLNRMSSGRLLLEPTEVEVAELVAEAARSIGPFAAEMAVRISVHCPARLTVMVDPQRLEQIVVNLLSNAVKFSPQGGEVVATGERLDGRVRITVHDRGPGIAPEHLESVFESFVQVHSLDARRQGGSGLGLTIARALAEQMGGTVGVESTLGEGSRFHVEFPEAGEH